MSIFSATAGTDGRIKRVQRRKRIPVVHMQGGPLRVRGDGGHRPLDGGANLWVGAAAALLSWRCASEGHWSSIRGEVKNTSNKKLDHVTAVGTFRTASGDLVKTAMAMVEFNPIMPGQPSPFHVITTNNPEISKCEVYFKHLIGGQIAAKDMSQY